MESKDALLRELETLSELEVSEVLNFVMQLKGQITAEELECQFSMQAALLENDSDEALDDGEWIDL